MMQGAAQTDMLEVVSFMAGGHRFALEAAQVRSQQPAADSAELPAAEQLLGLPVDEASKDRSILLLKHDAGDQAVLVSNPVELQKLPISAIHPLPELIAARHALHGLKALALTHDGLTMLVDWRAAKKRP